MQVHITARHLELTTALADYVRKRLERVARHFQAVLRAQVVLSVEKHRHQAEIIVHANDHHDFRANAASTDLYAAVDLVAEKLHKHMGREKDRRVRGRRGQKRAVFLEPPGGFPPLFDGNGHDTLAPPITAAHRFAPRPMSVEEAVHEMERKNYTFLIFLNDDTLNVLYRRKDKTYGLLEPDV